MVANSIIRDAFSNFLENTLIGEDLVKAVARREMTKMTEEDGYVRGKVATIRRVREAFQLKAEDSPFACSLRAAKIAVEAVEGEFSYRRVSLVQPGTLVRYHGSLIADHGFYVISHRGESYDQNEPPKYRLVGISGTVTEDINPWNVSRESFTIIESE